MLVLRRAKLARKTAASGGTCRCPRRFTSLQPGGSNREHDGHPPSACGNHDRRGTLACGSRFCASLSREFDASHHEHPRPLDAAAHRALAAERRPVRVETRWEQAVRIAGQTRRRPASRRGDGGPTPRVETKAGGAFVRPADTGFGANGPSRSPPMCRAVAENPLRGFAYQLPGNGEISRCGRQCENRRVSTRPLRAARVRGAASW
jgi:hypothetical protein